MYSKSIVTFSLHLESYFSNLLWTFIFLQYLFIPLFIHHIYSFFYINDSEMIWNKNWLAFYPNAKEFQSTKNDENNHDLIFLDFASFLEYQLRCRVWNRLIVTIVYSFLYSRQLIVLSWYFSRILTAHIMILECTCEAPR